MMNQIVRDSRFVLVIQSILMQKWPRLIFKVARVLLWTAAIIGSHMSCIHIQQSSFVISSGCVRWGGEHCGSGILTVGRRSMACLGRYRPYQTQFHSLLSRFFVGNDMACTILSKITWAIPRWLGRSRCYSRQPHQQSFDYLLNSHFLAFATLPIIQA